MSENLDTKVLLRLMAWLSPAFPIGGFAYSGGLERAVHDGLVKDAASLIAWLTSLLRYGSLWNDAVLFGEAWRRYENEAALKEVAELGLALAGSAERHTETLSLGKAFAAAASAWPHPVLERLPPAVPFPVAVGAIAAGHGVPAAQALAAYLHAAVSQSVSAGIRLGVSGQVEGVAVLADIENLISQVAEQASRTTLDDLGGAAVQAEIASLRHETQHSRLFRS
ncbi:urease accessory protein UreF [Neorhizobium galegae]|uniref:urease accessory protein UreF n=1 Tax=Neorhizobium galegae TaxID=399 RepID=UPI000621EA02|nr:urease accessory protein UreF [Neorhizobium galegae]CDZ28245.1 Urease accessory protein UreF [Neorhizobium galegae bv. officinalis]MCM2500504.1 urease accessory protein UreF [Neorhizobium galegae]MCQ1773414.1 urease accessory protein UreF [Neorhizobium galegae]MCQ1779521.1 urease accessory protein UreF [Neorhizobium galegae]MCQ1795682.1 urease accessory protein UreF [Neorhizobium galegae]